MSVGTPILTPLGSGMNLADFLESLRLAVNRSFQLRSESPRLIISESASGRTIHLLDGDEATSVQPFFITEIYDDYVVGKRVDLETEVVVQGGEKIAKPWNLRKTPWNGRDADGFTITWVNATQRTVDSTAATGDGKRRQNIWPTYHTGTINNDGSLPKDQDKWPDILFCSQPVNGTGVKLLNSASGEIEHVVWQDVNVDARDWKDAHEHFGSLEISVSGEGSIDARTDTWDQDAQTQGQGGVDKFHFCSRVFYDHTESTPVLYGYSRYFTLDANGRIIAISAETRYEIDTPEEC